MAEISNINANISVSYADPTESAPNENTMLLEGTGQFNAVHSLTTEIITTHTNISTSHDYLAWSISTGEEVANKGGFRFIVLW